MSTKISRTKNTAECLEIYYYNATSIRGKLDDFNSHFTCKDNLDIISVSESWLNDSVKDAEVLNQAYNVYRTDRNLELSDKKDGGGVMLCAKKSLISKVRRDLETDIELLWVEITLSPNRCLYIGTVYINYPSLATLRKLDTSINNVINCMKPLDSMLIMGDLNLRQICWEYDPVTKVANITNRDQLEPVPAFLAEIIDSNSLQQFNTVKTCNDNILDLVLGNNLHASVCETSVAAHSTHKALEIIVNTKVEKTTVTTSRIAYNFKKADFYVICQLLTYISWSNLDYFPTVNAALCHVLDIVFAVIADAVPKVKICSKTFPVWYDAELISLVNEKERTHRQYVKTGRDKLSPHYARFCYLRTDIKRKQKVRYTQYKKDVSSQIKSNPKRFWSYVKSLRSSNSIPNVMYYRKATLNNHKEIASGFNSFFKSVFKQDATDIPFCGYRHVPMFHIEKITVDEMKNKLLSLNPHTSSGYDNLPATIFIKCADQLAYPLCKIFNMSIERGEYPDILKKNNIIPIFKQEGAKSDITCYRGISILPILGKVYETLVNDRLKVHLKHLINEKQHGFQAGKSTFTNLASYIDFVSKCLDNKLEVHSIYTDFQKAFDVVPNNLLLYKMQQRFGITNNVLKWFESYLKNRQQRVVLNGIAAEWVKVTSGVPQGSILGPLLFLMYVDDLPDECENSESLLFADDAKFFRIIGCLADCLLLQSDLNKIFAWCTRWKINLNVKKCFTMHFTNKRSNKIVYTYFFDVRILKNINVVKDLGVYLTPNLNFRFHIEKTVSSANRMLAFVRRVTKDLQDLPVHISLYRSLVLSKLEYCLSVWSPSQAYLIDKLERVQKRAVKWLAFKSRTPYRNVSYSTLCNQFNLTILSSRRNQLDLRNFNKLLNGRINCSYLLQEVSLYTPQRRTRRTPVFHSPARINLRKNTFLPRAHYMANLFTNQINIFETNVNSFKKSVSNLYFT